MALEPIFIFIALLTLFLAYKARQFQKDHKAANEQAEAKLTALESDTRTRCADWDPLSEPDHDTKAVLKAALTDAFDYGAQLKGDGASADSRAIRTLLADYLGGVQKAQGHEPWPLFHRALHCALLMGQQASQPKMAERIGEQEQRLREALKAGQGPLAPDHPAQRNG
ncbi:hypothetical protein [Ferrimonas balearica]|uniref:hypothetical protein n=1 Tax=Ferrimonas balearica TaxID=44012 RepID=UPI001C993198|nr:hypothetical protein [Ferrimonas balearica]MBY5993267.1 hypothetical protein [Ferrimonas balearica]